MRIWFQLSCGLSLPAIASFIVSIGFRELVGAIQRVGL